MEVKYLARYKNIQAPKCVSRLVLKMLELFWRCKWECSQRGCNEAVSERNWFSQRNIQTVI